MCDIALFQFFCQSVVDFVRSMIAYLKVCRDLYSVAVAPIGEVPQHITAIGI